MELILREYQSKFYDYGIVSFYPTKILSAYGDMVWFLLKGREKKALLLKNNGHSINNKNDCKVLELIQEWIVYKHIY